MSILFPTVDTLIVDGAIQENGIIVGYVEDGVRNREVGRGRGGRRGRNGGRGRGGWRRGVDQGGDDSRPGIVERREESVQFEMRMLCTSLIGILALWVILLIFLYF